MRRLKKRTRSDTHVSEARRARPRSWDRNVYLALLVLFFGALANYVAGDRLFLRADGLVMRDRTVIGATALVRVSEVSVQVGQRVNAGQRLVVAESLDILGRLAELSMREAEMDERGAQLHSELQMVRDLRPLAERRLKELRQRRDTLSDLEASHLVTAQTREDIQEMYHAADMRAASLAAQVDGLTEEIVAIERTRTRARAAVQDLRTRYRDGVHLSTSDGTVGDRVPAPGEVYEPGEPMLTLYRGEPYVLAYLPQGYLFDISVGETVLVSTGKLSRTGRIEEILPMSTPIPNEFRNAFRLRETRQLARIRLEAGPELPTMATVRITSDLAKFCALCRRVLRREQTESLLPTVAGNAPLPSG